MYNSFNQFYQALIKSSDLYVRELQERTKERDEISLILFVIPLIALFIGLIGLIPVVNNVNEQKDKVLALFCEIDNHVLKFLSTKAEKFINTINV